MSRWGVGLIGALAIGTAMPALAQQVDMATLSCGEFVAMDQMSTVATIFWIDGYFSGQRDTTVTDMGGLGQATAAIRQACQSAPAEPVFGVIQRLSSSSQR